MPNSSKYWRLKYQYQGKEKRLALRVYPEVSLDEARKLLAADIDPAETRKWDEINLDKVEWNIPAERMKIRRVILVPL